MTEKRPFIVSMHIHRIPWIITRRKLPYRKYVFYCIESLWYIGNFVWWKRSSTICLWSTKLAKFASCEITIEDTHEICVRPLHTATVSLAYKKCWSVICRSLSFQCYEPMADKNKLFIHFTCTPCVCVYGLLFGLADCYRCIQKKKVHWEIPHSIRH